MPKRVVLEDAKLIAELKGGKCISNIYLSAKEHMLWMCKNGHTWSASYTTIAHRRRWCPSCAGNKKLSLIVAQKEAKKYSGSCITRVYKNSATPMQWKCALGHEWRTSLSHIINDKSWCPQCSFNKLSKERKLVNGLDKAKILAQDKGGRCLSSDYINNSSHLVWQCNNGHTWNTGYNHIKNGTWCPECSPASAEQNKLYDIIKKIFINCNIKKNYRGFSWLKTKNNRKQEIDIWVPEIKLAIEYDGKQHFEPVAFSRDMDANEHFRKLKKLDENKNKLIKKHKNEIKYFIRFNYKEIITKKYVLSKLKKQRIFNNPTCNDYNITAKGYI